MLEFNFAAAISIGVDAINTYGCVSFILCNLSVNACVGVGSGCDMVL